MFYVHNLGCGPPRKIEGKWKDRSLASLEAFLSNSVCLAAAQWQPEPPGQPEQRGDPDHAGNADRRAHGQDDARLSEGVPAKKARTDATDTVASSGSSGPSWARVERAEDVMELRRLGPDLFEADIRFGERLIGDAQLLGTLPQFQAKLATLQVRELKSAQKAKATREQNAAGATSAGGKSMEPPEKKPRTLQEHCGREDIGCRAR